MPLDSSDWKRKAFHAGMGLFALLLRWLDWKTAAALAAVALLFNLFVMPRIGRGIYRDASKTRDPGIVAYPAMVLVLILLFRHELAAAAALWGMMAFGDPAASIVGKAVGGPRLPWNSKKTWAGFLAYAVVGAVAASFLWFWVSPEFHFKFAPLGFGGQIASVLFPVTTLGAFLESIETGIDDNWIPPLPCALVLAWVLGSMPSHWPPLYPLGWLIVFALNGVIGLAMFKARTVSVSGAVAGAVVGSLIFILGGWRYYVVLWTFFTFGTLATRIGYGSKRAAKTAQPEAGRRGARHVLANCGVATGICALKSWAPHEAFGGFTYLDVAFAAAFAAALADTLGTELGSLFGRRPVSLVERRVVPPGTPGAMSLPGLGGGLLGGAAIGLLAAALKVVPWDWVPEIAAAGLIASIAESVFVDAVRRQGRRLDHEFANAFNTLVGAVAPLCISWIRFTVPH